MDSFVSKVGGNERASTSKFQQFSYYAKDIGMIEYKRDVSEEKVSHYYLEAILSVKEWGRLKEKYEITVALVEGIFVICRSYLTSSNTVCNEFGLSSFV